MYAEVHAHVLCRERYGLPLYRMFRSMAEHKLHGIVVREHGAYTSVIAVHEHSSTDTVCTPCATQSSAREEAAVVQQ
jgi:hypothetical protein